MSNQRTHQEIEAINDQIIGYTTYEALRHCLEIGVIDTPEYFDCCARALQYLDRLRHRKIGTMMVLIRRPPVFIPDQGQEDHQASHLMETIPFLRIPLRVNYQYLDKQ